jgi:hypothetical protein
MKSPFISYLAAFHGCLLVNTEIEHACCLVVIQRRNSSGGQIVMKESILCHCGKYGPAAADDTVQPPRRSQANRRKAGQQARDGLA